MEPLIWNGIVLGGVQSNTLYGFYHMSGANLPNMYIKEWSQPFSAGRQIMLLGSAISHETSTIFQFSEESPYLNRIHAEDIETLQNTLNAIETARRTDYIGTLSFYWNSSQSYPNMALDSFDYTIHQTNFTNGNPIFVAVWSGRFVQYE